MEMKVQRLIKETMERLPEEIDYAEAVEKVRANDGNALKIVLL